MSTREQRRQAFKEEGPRDHNARVELRCQCGRLIGRFVSVKAARGFYGRCHRCKARIGPGGVVVEKSA